MNERVTTTNSVTDITDMVTVKHRKKTRLRKGVTVAATNTDDVMNAPTNMFTNATINTSAFASIDTSVDSSISDANSNPILIDTKTGETMTTPGSTTNGAPNGHDTPNASTLLIGDGSMSSDTATNTLGSSSSMENIRRGIWPQLRKDMKRMTHFMRKKISLSDRRNRIKEISIKQQCWEDEDEPETSKRTSRSITSTTTHDADRRSLSADSSHATSSSSQSANSTPVVLDDYDEDEDV